MAQIIRHRKGVLESVASIEGVSARKAELLVVTGSSVGSLSNEGLVFVGIDGTSIQSTNKIITGSTTPDLTGGSYSKSINGIPFYNSAEEKLYILGKEGNIEVKAQANTGGTNVYSSSQQVADDILTDNRNIDLGSGTFNTTNTGSFGHIAVTGNATIDGDITLGGNITIGDASSDSISFGGQVSSDIIPDPSNTYDLGSTTNKFAELHVTTINATNISDVSGSSLDLTGTLAVDGNTTIGGTLDSTGRISADNIGNAAGTSTFTGSFVGDGSGLTGLATNLGISGSDGNNFEIDLLNTALIVSGTTNEVDVTTSVGGTLKIGLPNDVTISNDLTVSNDVTISGNLTVAGTQTIVDSTTVQIGDNILELNGSGATNGGIYVADATAPNTDTGSLVWDSTNDYWKAGTKGNEIEILVAGGQGIVSQSLLNDLTNDEVNQLKNIDTTTISTTQWGYLGAADQGTATSDNVTFAGISGSSVDITGTAKIDGNSTLGGTLDVTGNTTVGGTLDVTGNLSTAGISGSSLDITGNAKIDGNLTLGGNITIGDASTDTIAFGGDLTTDIIPDVTNTVDLGSSTRVFAEAHATNFYGTTNGTVNATNGVISGSAQLLNVATDFGTGRVSGDNFGDVAGTSTFTGSFVGDGSGLTGLSTDLTIADGLGNSNAVDLINDTLTFDSGSGANGIEVTVSTDKVSVTGINATTTTKGVASFVDDDFSVSAGAVSIKNGGVRAVNLNADVVGDGIELDGTNNDLNVLYGSTANTAVQGNTTLAASGSDGEIEITTSDITLGSGGTIGIRLSENVTTRNNLTVSNDLSVGGNTTITGNLYVEGTTTTVDSTTVQIGDNILELNYGQSSPNAGLLVTDATGATTTSGSLVWSGSADYWAAGPEGDEKEIARLGASPSTNTILKSDANGLIVDSVLSDDGTDATFSGDVIISGLSAPSSFIYADGSKTLTAVAPSQAGDVIQWNGSSFVASNELDGGTF